MKDDNSYQINNIEENYKNDLNDYKYEYDNKIQNTQDNMNYEINNLKENLNTAIEDANYEFNENLKRLKEFFDDQLKAKKIADLIEADLLRYSNEVDIQIKNFII